MELSMGEKIKIVMKRRKMTYGELADKLGQSRQNLSNKMSRDNFSEKEIRQIAEVLNCTFIGTFTLNDTNETI